MWWEMGHDWGIGLFGILSSVFGLLLAIGIIALIIWLIVRLSKGSGTGSTSQHQPLDIARGRYARGEISREEFEQIKEDLSK